MRNKLIAALDVSSRAEADAFVARLDGAAGWLKIGLELFIAEGSAIVRDYAQRHSVMLDLKLHDIPETVRRATKQVAQLGAKLVTVHAGGGKAMLEAAVEAAKGTDTRILAVTVLTSLDDGDLAQIGAHGPVAELVRRRAQLALDSGCHGVVASGHEVAAIRALGPELVIVTPGVRPSGSAAGDQKRVMTPADAKAAGASLVVVGRPLRDAADPAALARQIARELD